MPCETTLAICSLLFSGVYTKYPNLKVCFAHGGGSFIGTLGRIQHGFHARPDLTQTHTTQDPFSQLHKIYVDSLTHDKDMLVLSLKKLGHDKVFVGSDYPFPLGDAQPGQAIRELTQEDINHIGLKGLSLETLKNNLLRGNLLKFLNIV